MFLDTQKVTIKEGSIIPEEEAIIRGKTEKILREIEEKQNEVANVRWYGHKPTYSYYVVGFSSDLRIGEEKLPAVVLNGIMFNRENMQFNVAANKKGMIFNSRTSDKTDIMSTIRKTMATFKSKAVIVLLSDRV